MGADVNGNFTTEIGRLRTEESINRAASYQEFARAKKQQGDDRSDAGQPDKRGSQRALTFLYRKALRIGALSVVFVSLLATAAMAGPSRPGIVPTGPVQRGVEATTRLSDSGGGTSLFWIVTMVALAAGVAAVLISLNKQRASKAA